jgi:hypothetical protein
MPKCKECGAEILFARTQKDKLMPIEYNSARPDERFNLETYEDEIKYDFKRHIPHFIACKGWKEKEKKRKLEQTTLKFDEE